MQIFAGKKFENPIKIIEAFDNKSFIEAFLEIEQLRQSHYLLGYIRYEAKEIFLGKKVKSDLPLLYFEVFNEMQRCEDAKTQSENFSAFPLFSSSAINYKTYSKAIRQIKEEIACGNTYQVNYTYDYKIETNTDGFELYKDILPRQTTPYNAYIKNDYEEILSFSPELFFTLEGNKILTKPMKGTVKRGKDETEDKINIEFLRNDIKNRAENVMIVDLLRNDLGKIAKTGSVKVEKLFEIETHNTVHQMTSEITAELEDNTTLFDIFEALFPCGSVTGTPKINTMKIIEGLEIGHREVYCGAIGLISPEKTVFSVPIRILQRKTGQKYFLCRVGGAIVWDSTAKDEWEETLTKIKFLNYHTRHPELVSGSHGLLPDAVGLDTIGDNYLKQGKILRTVRTFCTKTSFRQKKSTPTYFYVLNKNKAVGWDCYPTDIKLVETILVKNGEMKHRTAHLNRMKKSAKELGFEFRKWEIENRKWQTDCILRILLNKEGVFETQYLPLNATKTTRVTVSKTPVNSKEPLLYHKTTYRPWYDEAMKKIKAGDPKNQIFDEIFFNEKGELTEGARSNVILQINGGFFTPPVECGLLNGILRQKLLKEKKIKEKKLYFDDLKNAEKIFCINSVRGIVEVNVDFCPRTLWERMEFQHEARALGILGEGGNNDSN